MRLRWKDNFNKFYHNQNFIFYRISILILIDSLSLKPDCCVDIVGAKHIIYDLIIHFGLACFTEVNENVEYVFPRVPVDH
jgi:diphthamide biosynthesis enzyme Dph1/Dph2-like protein